MNVLVYQSNKDNNVLFEKERWNYEMMSWFQLRIYGDCVVDKFDSSTNPLFSTDKLRSRW